MENDNLKVRKFTFQNKIEKKKNNFPKSNPNLQVVLTGKYNNEEITQKLFPSLVKKRRKNKFNSIDNMPLHYKSNKIKNIKKDNINSSPSNTKNIQFKNDNYKTESLVDKLYEDEPHLKKSVFKKKANKVNLKNFNRKVSFLCPKKNNQNIINLIKSDQNLNIDTNDSKIKLIKDEQAEEPLYGFDKNYSINMPIKSKNEEIAKSSIFGKDTFFGRSLKRKQTCKSCKSNISKRRGIDEKKSINKSNHNFKRKASKKMTSKSNEKKYKKKSSKIIKENNKEKNNNINNKDDKLKLDKNKTKKCVTMNDKNNKNDKNIKKEDNEEAKNNKNQELPQKKSIDNVETLVQIENQNNKKRKKNSWCNPFFLCLNMNNNEENDIN